MCRSTFKSRLLASAAIVAALAMAGCSTTNTAGITGSVASGTAPQSESDWLSAYSRLSHALGRVPVTAPTTTP